MPDPEKVAAVRALLPATGAGIYLNAGTCGPMPAETQHVMVEQSARELAIGRAHPDLWPEALQRMDEARSAVAAITPDHAWNRQQPPAAWLEQVNRQALVTRLLFATVHDVNNTLQVVSGAAEVLAMDPTPAAVIRRTEDIVGHAGSPPRCDCRSNLPSSDTSPMSPSSPTMNNEPRDGWKTIPDGSENSAIGQSTVSGADSPERSATSSGAASSTSAIGSNPEALREARFIGPLPIARLHMAMR